MFFFFFLSVLFPALAFNHVSRSYLHGGGWFQSGKRELLDWPRELKKPNQTHEKKGSNWKHSIKIYY